MRILIFCCLIFFISCNTSEKVNPGTEEKQQAEEKIPLPVLRGKYVILIHQEQCIYCYPVFQYTSEIFKKKFNPDEVLYVFPDMRKIRQKKFLEESFNLSSGDATFIFNDKVYERMMDSFQLIGMAYFLSFHTSGALKYKQPINKTAHLEITSFLMNEKRNDE